MTKTQRLLRHWFKATGLSQREAAERLGVTQGTLSHWLTNRRKPSLNVLDRVSKVTGINPLELRPDFKSAFRNNGKALTSRAVNSRQ